MSVGWGYGKLPSRKLTSKKLHKWVLDGLFVLTPRDKAKYNIHNSFHYMKCKKCGLHKYNIRYDHHLGGKYETYYFTVSDDGYIMEGSLKKGTLPYECGYKEKMLLTDKDFEIDI